MVDEEETKSASKKHAGPKLVPDMIQLTSLETRIFDCLTRVVVDKKLSTTLRVAGGWVRDKILGVSTSKVDIDIALDNMLGRRFAELVNDWFVEHGQHKAHMGVIAKNPDQSKHLETATMNLFDTWIDLVNLRTETYRMDSRIPEIAIGTPLEDAMRRDLTINALFYNINERSLEDFTGRGLEDIRSRVIRTPLPPVTTLLDDPLRALRAIRFASRLNFHFDESLFDACKNAEVHAALDTKVSRERIGQELEGIMSSKRPHHALGLLCEFNLFSVVFRLPKEPEYAGDERPPEDVDAISLGRMMTLASLCHHTSWCTEKLSTEDQRIAKYATLLSPFGRVQCSCGGVRRNRKKPVPLVYHVMSDELRMSSNDASNVCQVHESSLSIRSLVHRGDLRSLDRLTIGRTVRKAGRLWRIAILVALIEDLPLPDFQHTFASRIADSPKPLTEDASVIVENYKRFQDAVEDLKLEDVWELKPLLNGADIFKLLPKLRRGPMVGEIISKQIEWQIENPQGSHADCVDWLKEAFAEFRNE